MYCILRGSNYWSVFCVGGGGGTRADNEKGPTIFFENALFRGNFRGISANYILVILSDNLEFLGKLL
jgi:hypothetical protein